MENIFKYLDLLEEVDKSHNQKETSNEYFSKLIDKFEKKFGQSVHEIANKDETLQNKSLALTTDSPLSWQFSCCLYHILLSIQKTIDLDHPIDDVDFLDKFIKTIVTASLYGLNPYLHEDFLKHKCFNSVFNDSIKCTNIERYERLIGSVKVFSILLQNKQVLEHYTIEHVVLQYLAAVFTLKSNDHIDNVDDSDQQAMLDLLYENHGKRYFKCLLILKSMREQPLKIKELLHNELMLRLNSKGGFMYLCKNLLLPQKEDSEQPAWKRAEVIFKIIGHKGHSHTFYLTIIDEIYNFFKKSHKSTKNRSYIPVCIGSLKKIYGLSLPDACQKIENLFLGPFEQIALPEDIITGSIILDDQSFRNLLLENFSAFCGPFTVSLRSKMLLPYLPVLLQLHSQLQDNSEQQNQITSLIIQCLGNRQGNELKNVINSILYEEYPSNMKQIHPRVIVKYNESAEKYSIQIGPDQTIHYYDPPQQLIKILKISKHNILIYSIFLHLLKSLEDCVDTRQEYNTDLIDDWSELTTLMMKSFKKRIAIIYSLTELINYKPFHCQFNENPGEILDLIKCILIKKINVLKHQNQQPATKSEDDQIMIVFLSIVREFLQKVNELRDVTDFIRTIKEFDSYCKDPELKTQIAITLDMIDESRQSFSKKSTEKSQFQIAMQLCEKTEPHLKVYGLMLFMKLIQNDRDEEAIANKHTILAIALDGLKDEDSYAFLNCIKLLVALIDILESEVFDNIIVEFQNEDNSIDYRLKIGEVLVKVTEGLGPISYKYKNDLINCFLRGCTNKNDELRTSSLSNLGSICRILSYQVHNFFEELMIVIQSVIQTDKYIPARRAAILVLSHLVYGMDNLIDFQDILLPVYRTLRYVITSEDDQSTLIHANIGLERLHAKIKELLQARQSMEKEIKIFGVKDTCESAGKNNKTNILRIV